MRNVPLRYLQPTQYELEAEKNAQGWGSAPQTGGAIGSMAGGAIGAGLGLLAGPAAPIVSPLLSSIGGTVGGLAGQAIGGGLDEHFGGAERQRLLMLQQARQRKIDRVNARNESLQRLLSGNWYGG